MVRRTIHSGWVLRIRARADGPARRLKCAGRRHPSGAAIAVDVTHLQRPLRVEHIGMGIGNGIIVLASPMSLATCVIIVM